MNNLWWLEQPHYADCGYKLVCQSGLDLGDRITMRALLRMGAANRFCLIEQLWAERNKLV